MIKKLATYAYTVKEGRTKEEAEAESNDDNGSLNPA